jgi:hypothetical protein
MSALTPILAASPLARLQILTIRFGMTGISLSVAAIAGL